jgi:hypothetical protein
MAAWVERTTTGAPVRYGIEFKLSEDEVWPGDTNNDGTVNADDVVPLAAYWGDTAPARSGSGQTVWSAHPVASSLSVAHGFADANGDGVVGAHDVLPIGLNWGRTHATRGPSYIPPVAALDAEALAAAVREIRATLASAGSGPAAEMIRVLDALIASSAEGATETGAGTGSLAASPNPTDGMTRVHFRLPQAGRVTVAIYDARGRLVRSVLDEERAQGNGEALWDGLDGRGIAAPAGLYFARIEAPGVRMSEKILRVK